MNQKKSKKLNNNLPKSWIITGASSGIGYATALKAAEKGSSLVLVARRLKELIQLQKICLKVGAKSVDILAIDITSDEGRKTFSLFLKKNPSIDVLVNNAGLAAGVDLFQNSQPSDWDKMFDLNVRALMWISHQCLPSLIKSKGQIINLGSVAGRLVYEGGAVYCATKFAVRALSEGFRMDLKGTGVRVTNIEPGMVKTEFSLVRLGNQQKADAVYSEMMPLSANDIAESILWCVDRPRHVNIQELVIYPTDQASVGQVVRGEKSIKKLINCVP